MTVVAMWENTPPYLYYCQDSWGDVGDIHDAPALPHLRTGDKAQGGATSDELN